uniref:Uncharacterized protein n=1 Tax=Physcomitrium patens TaxID=3218 RepID=A0A2K1ID74_PHYPA|nr:hypothetical protein PHYPA_030697 [Physcomitrium patens]
MLLLICCCRHRRRCMCKCMRTRDDHLIDDCMQGYSLFISLWTIGKRRKYENNFGRKMEKKQKSPNDGYGNNTSMVWCEFCECEVSNKKPCLDQHFQPGSKHERKEKLALFKSLFEKEGLDYFPGGTTYYCQKCKMQLPNVVGELLYHIKKFAYNHGDDKKLKTIEFSLNEGEIFIQRSMRLVDFETTNKGLTEQLLRLPRSSFLNIESPTILTRSGFFKDKLIDLRNGIFTPKELRVITKIVSYLEKGGRNLCRSPAKESSSISMFGMRSAYGDTGWYIQNRPEYYHLSEELAKYTCHILRRSYESLFQHLDNIVIAEGFSNSGACIGNGPFTSFAITRDFNCRPHRDEDDYDFGFIIWLREDPSEQNEPAIFAFPEASIMFVPKHGDVCVFRPSELLHCTRRLQGKGLLGLAFFQKCSLYRQLGRLIHPDGPGIIDYKDKNGNVRVVETREGFLEKKRLYERHLLENQFSIKEFMGKKEDKQVSPATDQE